MTAKSPLQAALQGKCPRCRKGDMFEYPLQKITKFYKMHENCPHCGHRFEVEPGYFYGAMYVSYALSVGIFLVTAFILYFLAGDPPLETYIISVVVVALVLYPLNFRFSRILFAHVFGGIKYDPSK
ncbi:DUF983 domain-containing protein [Marinoscillum sp.]|uniref:DUF983 domain-containing protein n=1 Tax=Marinoscillum sp. TaxID=2024838 RepID=UPI003BAAEE92